MDNRPPAIEKNIYWFPHGNPADYEETFGKQGVQQAFLESRKQPDCKKAQKQEKKRYYKILSSPMKKPPQVDFSKEFLVRKVVSDSFFEVSFDFCTYFFRRKIYHDLKGFIQRKFIYSIVNVFFRVGVKFFFTEWSRVKGIE